KISFSLKLPEGNPHFYFAVAPMGEPKNDTQFFVSVHGSFGTQEFMRENIKADSADPQWKEEDLDFSKYAGKEIKLELRTSGGDDESFAGWSSPEIFNVAQPHSYKNVILFSIDTMRRDRVSYYGYNLKTTPNLDSLAAGSIVYQNAFCTFPGTLSSH